MTSMHPQSGEVAEAVGSHDLIKLLECPVCNAVPYPPIYGCFNGHIVCNFCRPRLRHCALCRKPFWEGRNHVVESIVNSTKFYCNFKDSGCDKVLLGCDVKNHLRNCQFGPRLQIQQPEVIEEPSLIKWIHCANGALPDSAVEGGQDEQGMALYVARAEHAGGKIPGKFSIATGKVYIPWNCVEHEKTEYEILTAPPGVLTWAHGYFGYTPPLAVQGGPAETGEMLYIGRWSVSGYNIIGKIHPSHRCCYIGFEGQELARQHYEVLTRTVDINFEAPEEAPQPIPAAPANAIDVDPITGFD